MKRNCSYLTILLLAAALSFVLTGCGPSESTTTAKDPAAQTRDEHGHVKDQDHDKDHADEHGDAESEAEDIHEGEEEIVHLSDRQLTDFGIELATAGPGQINTVIELPGEITVNGDRLAHIVPRVAGIVRNVHKSLGDTVTAGEVLAELESRELAELKVAYLSARERLALAQELFQREEKLWQKQISAEQDFLSARQALAEARIALRAAEQKLHAVGFSEAQLVAQAKRHDASLTRYLLTAPFGGTIIDKHLTLGETVQDDAEVFVVADLSSVWVDIKVYPKDLAAVRKGQAVAIDAGHQAPAGQGVIDYLGPIVGETTRTVPARVVLDNRDGRWRPGTFITARIAIGSEAVAIMVPRTALQTVDDRKVVFVHTPEGFTPQTVALGRSDGEQLEIASGLEAGQRFVAKGAFTLKAQLSKGAFGDGHNH